MKIKIPDTKQKHHTTIYPQETLCHTELVNWLTGDSERKGTLDTNNQEHTSEIWKLAALLKRYEEKHQWRNEKNDIRLVRIALRLLI
jgi:hypothetical protein